MQEKRQLAKEEGLYESLRVEFERNHHLEWIVVHDEEVFFFTDFQEAAEEAVKRFGRGPYLIRQVGAPRPVLPISVFIRPIYEDS